MQITPLLNTVEEIINHPIMSPLIDDKACVESGETTGNYKLAVPGKSKEDISIKLKKNRLYIYIHDKFKKSIHLTNSIDKDNIEVSVDKGVLEINFEKKMGDNEGEEIKIN